ncbi:MAG: GlxA family transcriptional regulator [Flavobacterium sp.]
MKVGIVLQKDYRLLSVAAIADVLDTVNGFYAEGGKPPKFDIRLLRLPNHTEVKYEGFTVDTISPDDAYDLLMIPAFKNDSLPAGMQLNLGWLPWLAAQYAKGGAVASFCTGAFVLAATGLLNGRPATTHVNAGGHFAQLFPEVVLRADAVVTGQDRVYTSGGATNTFHLLMLLLEVYCSKEIAVRAAKMFSIDMDRNRQTYFGSFLPHENHTDDLVKKAQQEIRRNFNKANTIEEIISSVPASRRNLARRFKQVTGITPIEYLQKTRIEAAKQLLEQQRHTITEVMLESGYNDQKTFRTLFKRNVGMTPKMYREKFSGQAV